MKNTYQKEEITSLEILAADLKARRDNCEIYMEMHEDAGDGTKARGMEIAAQVFDVALERVEYLLKNRPFAAGPWRTDEPPKDGSTFLGYSSASHDACTILWDEEGDGGRGEYITRDNNIIPRPDRWAKINLPSGGRK